MKIDLPLVFCTTTAYAGFFAILYYLICPPSFIKTLPGLRNNPITAYHKYIMSWTCSLVCAIFFFKVYRTFDISKSQQNP